MRRNMQAPEQIENGCARAECSNPGAAVTDPAGVYRHRHRAAVQFVKSRRLKAIGVSSGRRSSALPDVPTFAESGLPRFVVDSWVGVLAPARTPPLVIERLQREIAATLAEPAVRERYGVLGIEPVGNTPEQFAAQIRWTSRSKLTLALPPSRLAARWNGSIRSS
jgi:hypothetical protein